ncbi:MAG: ATP synthase F1 subunit gamma [Candidatus Eisenbacteria bacterium]|uniref:ATP synthase gamma chain n=1 Tax=Eiseniibacteriota bacterium TaxID=2212470 RepID=A0A538U2K0_UNCEI|nr:MAG: ATP synthase F1 subunit gamma [Candidatus Eisenbacteria bacterium]
MSSLRVLRRRIRSVQNTQQITKAMEMVAAAKLRRAQSRAQAARPYASKITEMLENLAGAAGEIDHPLFKAREVKTTALVLVTADRGLCGSYNANLVRGAEQRLRNSPTGAIQLVLVGKKGRDYFKRRRYPVLAVHTPVPAEASIDFARTLTQDLIDRFVSGQVDRVELMFTRFISALQRRVVVETFLPVGAAPAEGRPQNAGTIFEPDAESIFGELLPRYAGAKLFAALADSLAAEHSARMIAMGSARKNAGELLDLLVLRRNRLRQAVITKELLEIVGGAEALNG